MPKKYLPNTKLHIIESISRLDDTSRIEVSLVATDDKPLEEMIDIRQWNIDHTKCTYGVTLNKEQAYNLLVCISEYFGIPMDIYGGDNFYG